MPVLNGKFYPYRNFTAGEKITSLDELASQDKIFFEDQLLSRGWFSSWQLGTAEKLIKAGLLKHVIKKENKDV